MAEYNSDEEYAVFALKTGSVTKAEKYGALLEKERNKNALKAGEVAEKTYAEKRKPSFNIDTFRNEIGQNGVLPTHSFILFINSNFIPGILGNEQTAQDRHKHGGDMLAMRCDTASIPGVNLMLNDTVSEFGYGPITRMPYAAQFNVLNLNFVVDEAAHILKFWDVWMNKVVFHRSKGGRAMRNSNYNQSSDPTRLEDVAGYAPYEVGYKRGKGGYAIPQMTLHVYDRKQLNVMEITFYDAFPIQKNDINLSWGEQDTPMRFQVALTYTDFDVKYSKIASSTQYTSEEIVVDAPRRKESLAGKLKDNVSTAVTEGISEGLNRSWNRALNKIF